MFMKRPGEARTIGISGVLHNDTEEVILIFLMNVGVKDSNKAEVLGYSGSLRDLL